MQTGRLLKFTFSLLAVCFLNPGAIRSQESTTPSPPAKSPRDGTYPDSADGLQKLLSDLISSLKNGENDRVAGALRNMEVPDCDAWLHRHYPADSADSWMGLCDPKILAVRERELQKQLESFVQQSGRIATRIATNDPGGSALAPPNNTSGGRIGDSYFAAWKLPGQPDEARGEPIGYFGYLDGAFRWDSNVSFPKFTFSSPKIIHAKLIEKVEPVYPAAAAAQHITGTVRVYYVIGGDGKVYNAHALSGEGLSEDPGLRKAAEEAVLQWKYRPATMDGKPIETNAVTFDLRFPPDSK
jgi:TonB family protein